MKKFPVTSENGNDYEVRVMLIESFGVATVALYSVKSGLFGITWRKNLNYGIIGFPEYSLAKWNYNFVEMAKAEVRDYEGYIAEALRRKQQRAKGIEAFAEWDGK